MESVEVSRKSYIKKVVKLRTQVVNREITRQVYKTTVGKIKVRVAPITKISKTNFEVMKGKMEKMVVENKMTREKFQTSVISLKKKVVLTKKEYEQAVAWAHEAGLKRLDEKQPFLNFW